MLWDPSRYGLLPPPPSLHRPQITRYPRTKKKIENSDQSPPPAFHSNPPNIPTHPHPPLKLFKKNPHQQSKPAYHTDRPKKKPPPPLFRSIVQPCLAKPLLPPHTLPAPGKEALPWLTKNEENLSTGGWKRLFSPSEELFSRYGTLRWRASPWLSE
jgi:hypothetical protein